MSKHTEGPWEWANGTHALVGPKIDDKPVWLRPVVLRAETAVSAADARLIAAAPALLEALQRIDMAIVGSEANAESATDWRSDMQAAKEIARAAIAAATAQAGEQQ